MSSTTSTAVVEKQKRPKKDEEEEAAYQRISETVLKGIIPDVYQTSMDHYLRGCDDMPADFVQTEPERVRVSFKDILKHLDPKLCKGRRHILITGAAGIGKTLLAHKLTDEVIDHTLHALQQQHMTFFLDVRYYDGNNVVTIPQFLFARKAEEEPPEIVDVMYSAVTGSSSKIIFVLNALDQLIYDFESECEPIDLSSKATARVILHNLLAGNIIPNCKIITTCRNHRVKYFKGKLRPDMILEVEQLSKNSAQTLAKGLIGNSEYHLMLEVWNQKCPELCFLNRNPQLLVHNVVSGGMSEPLKFAKTMPMAMLQLVMSTVYRNCFLTPTKDKVSPPLLVIHKMKRMAFHTVQVGKRSLKTVDVEKKFNITRSEFDATCMAHPGKSKRFFCMFEIRDYGVVIFVDQFIQNILCALHVTELPLREFRLFLTNFIHTPRYHLIRRMVCGLILDPEVRKLGIDEKLIIASDDMDLRQELLQASMLEEYRKVKHRELLEFFHSIHDSGEGGADIIPKEIDVVDLSHIHLFLHDIIAIGASLSPNINIGYLNLQSCGISSEAMRCFADKLTSSKTKISKLNIDWCQEWMEYFRGVHGLGDIVRKCEVTEVSMNHNQMTPQCLHALSAFLEKAKVESIYLEGNALGDDVGFDVLGDFIFRHSVQNLYISAENLTPKQKSKLDSGLRKIQIVEKITPEDKTMAIGKLRIEELKHGE